MKQKLRNMRLRGMLKKLVILRMAVVLMFTPLYATADNPDVYPSTSAPEEVAVADPQAPKAPVLTADQLNTLVAPIALYPDPLISQILVATTYPLEIVQAAQWLQAHPELKGETLTSAAQQQNWDPSIQALVLFPDVIKRLSEDVTWTTNIGNAFLAQQADVMDAIQRMRLKAEQSGKLTSTEQQKVTTSNQDGQTVVQIEPTNPQVVYVPYYDPAVIWGPPVYYSYPIWRYPPAPRVGVFFWFGNGVWLSSGYSGCCGWGGWGWHPYWTHRTVVVNNSFIHRYNFSAPYVRTFNGTTVWRHDSVHRLGVAYPTRALGVRYRPTVYAHPVARPSVAQVRTEFHASQQRVHDHLGHRDIPAGGYNRNHSAFGGIEDGSRARMHSDRGYSSLSRTHSSSSVGSPGNNSGTAHIPNGNFHGGGGGGHHGH